MRTNPSKGPIHFRSPARFFLKTIRGMVPHKTKRGADALERLMAFEGIPAPHDKMKRMVVPDALQVLRLQPGRKFCVLGDLCEEAGWRYYDTIKVLEEKRKAQSKVFYERKKQLMQLRLQVSKRIEVRSNACWRRGRQFW